MSPRKDARGRPFARYANSSGELSVREFVWRAPFRRCECTRDVLCSVSEGSPIEIAAAASSAGNGAAPAPEV